jgi:glycosyltransferase involved in cell wall biosynthesis
VTIDDSSDPGAWSGIPYHMALALVRHGVTLERVGPLRTPVVARAVARTRQMAHRLERRGYPFHRDPGIVRAYAREAALRLRHLDVDAVLSPGTIPIADLDVGLPVVSWTDATFAAMVDYYPAYCGLSEAALLEGDRTECAAIARVDAAFYASDWAADSALRLCGASAEKVRVVPFGANLTSAPDHGEVASRVEKRSRRECRLLFLGVDWRRKGGDLALKVVTRLVEMGCSSRLTVAGCPPGDVPVSDLVDCVGFVDKSTPSGEAELVGLLADSHFLCLPSRAECFGIVFCEASACGVPSVALRTGGVPSAVRDGSNGYLFDERGFIDGAAAAIAECMADFDRSYVPLALSSREEYCSRLNWATSTGMLIDHVSGLLAR